MGNWTPVERTVDGVRLIDQRKLPLTETHMSCETPEQVAAAIKDMVVRGAPAIGIAAAFGVAMGVSQSTGLAPRELDDRLERICRLLLDSRPTAVNLRWAVERMQGVARTAREEGRDNQAIADRLEEEARRIHAEDLAACRAMGRHGAALVPEQATVLTHCNAGGLATAGYGTALGVIRSAVESGKKLRVLAGETRPFLQGARLTAWELLKDGIDTELITDSTAGSLMFRGEIDVVVVGADRIAANGDTANKIGTYPLAVLAKENDVPFFVAAPTSTLDLSCADGSSIPIEQRSPDEVTELMGARIAPPGVRALNPAFDVTPARYIQAIITEHGIARPPYAASLRRLISTADSA